MPLLKAYITAARGKKNKILAVDNNETFYFLLGMKDEALHQIEKILEASQTDLPHNELINFCIYDFIRDDPQFQRNFERQKKG